MSVTFGEANQTQKQIIDNSEALINRMFISINNRLITSEKDLLIYRISLVKSTVGLLLKAKVNLLDLLSGTNSNSSASIPSIKGLVKKFSSKLQQLGNPHSLTCIADKL
jgi:hypothetical protein